MRLIPTLVLLTLAAPAIGQEAIETVADGLTVSAPDMLMRAAVANCLIYGAGGAVDSFLAAGWEGDQDDGGLWTVQLDEVVASLSPDLGLCVVASPIVGMADAALIAADLVTTSAGGTAMQDMTEDGCVMIWSDEYPDDTLVISSDGNDPTCEDTGVGGSAISYEEPGE